MAPSSALHLHPLTFDLTDLPSLSSTELALIAFHSAADPDSEKLAGQIYRLWTRRRERARM